MSRRRSTRALNNDEAIRDAAVKVVLTAGIDAISFRDVGREAGLTHGAIYARFEDVEELLVDLWDGVLSARAITMVTVAAQAATAPSERTVAALIDFIREATPTDVATVQVLFASRRFLILHEEVEGFIHDYLESVDTSVPLALRSRTLVLFSLITIMILANDQFGIDDDCLDFLRPLLSKSLTVDPDEVTPVELHGSEDRVLPLPRNDIRAKLVYHTFSAVGRSGYARATISRISRRAGYSPGAIYKLYPSKEDLVIDAIRNLMEAPWITISSLANLLDEGSLAQLLYSSASEENAVRKSFTLEVATASAYSEKLRSAVQAQLQGLEALVPLITDIGDDEAGNFSCFIRSTVLLTLGVSFLSTVTRATDEVDFNQFAEPLRLEILRQGIPSWSEIRRQLEALAGLSVPTTSQRK